MCIRDRLHGRLSPMVVGTLCGHHLVRCGPGRVPRGTALGFPTCTQDSFTSVTMKADDIHIAAHRSLDATTRHGERRPDCHLSARVRGGSPNSGRGFAPGVCRARERHQPPPPRRDVPEQGRPHSAVWLAVPVSYTHLTL